MTGSLIDDISLSDIIKLEIGKSRNGSRKKQHLLQQLFWECTLNCNLKCQHCGSDCRVNEQVSDMPLNDFLKVLDEIAMSRKPHEILVITTGGEPLVRADIIECGREISRRGFKWGMVSNGMTLSESKLNSLIDAGLATIAISLDGFEEEHNWMRGNPQSFSNAVNAIRLLCKSTICWDVITCVNRKNIASLNRFRDFLISIGVRNWRIFTVFPSGRAKGNSDFDLSGLELKQLMDFIVNTRKEGHINLSYSCEGFLGRYENKVRNYQFFCQAGINVASILADGSISGCLSIRGEYHQGNIYRDSFIDVWEHRFDIYRNRSWMKTNECKVCAFWRYCEGNGMHLRDSDGNLMHCNLQKMSAAGPYNQS